MATTINHNQHVKTIKTQLTAEQINELEAVRDQRLTEQLDAMRVLQDYVPHLIGDFQSEMLYGDWYY